MAETDGYHRGEMPVEGQKSTYTLFNSMVHWCGMGIAALVAFLVIWLCAHAGIFPALIVAAVIMGVAMVLNRKPGH